MRFIFIFILSLLLLGSAQAKVNSWKDIQAAVNDSVSELLPQGSSWEVKTPAFLKSQAKEIEDIQVLFPSGLKSDRMVAQVRVKTANNEISLFAIPITIHSLGGSELKIANN